MMTDADYLLTQKRITDVGNLALAINVDGFLERVKQAETVGPMVDPTTFLKAQPNLRAIKKLAECVKAIQGAQDQLIEAVTETLMKGHMTGPL